MARAKGFIVTGDRAVNRVLKELPLALQKKVVRQAMRRAMKPVLAEAKAKVPVGEGELKQAIKLRAMKRSRKRIGVEVGVDQGAAGTEGRYVGAVEFGTSKEAAQPFLRPAFDTRGPGAVAAVSREILGAVEREAKRLAGKGAGKPSAGPPRARDQHGRFLKAEGG